MREHRRIVTSAGAVALAVFALAACSSDIRLGAAASGPDGDAGGADGGDGGDAATTDAATDASGGPVLWRATFEPGDLSEWLDDGMGHVYEESNSVSPVASREHAEAGAYSGKITLEPSNGTTAFSYLNRQQVTPNETYLSAWFFFPEDYAIKNWLNLFHFSGSRTGDGRYEYSMWDVDVQSQPDGSLAPYAWDFNHNMRYDPPSPVTVPTKDWFHLEVMYRRGGPSSGHLAVWVDGVMALDIGPIETSQNDWVRFNLGGATADIVPVPAYVFLDDVVLATARQGP